MIAEIKDGKYFDLTIEEVRRSVPRSGGIYILAIQLANGVHKSLFLSQALDLRESLTELIQTDFVELPEDVAHCLQRYRCYAAYFLMGSKGYEEELERMFESRVDPINHPAVVNCN
jgi:hypothetical protein